MENDQSQFRSIFSKLPEPKENQEVIGDHFGSSSKLQAVKDQHQTTSSSGDFIDSMSDQDEDGFQYREFSTEAEGSIKSEPDESNNFESNGLEDYEDVVNENEASAVSENLNEVEVDQSNDLNETTERQDVAMNISDDESSSKQATLKTVPIKKKILKKKRAKKVPKKKTPKKTRVKSSKKLPLKKKPVAKKPVKRTHTYNLRPRR